MDTVDVHNRLRRLMEERGWSEYRLSKECGLSQSTIANVLRRNTMPSVATLETICAGMGITMSQFFADGEMVEMNDDLKALFEAWRSLTAGQKQAVLQIIEYMK